MEDLINLAESLKTELNAKYDEKKRCIVGTYNGKECRIEYLRAQNNNPTRFSFTIINKSPQKFKIRKRNWLDNLGKKLNLLSENKTNDIVFDGKFFIEGEKTQYLSEIIQNYKSRKIAEDLFNTNQNAEAIGASKIGFYIEVKPSKNKITSQDALVYFSLLNEFMKDVPVDFTVKPSNAVIYKSIFTYSFIALLFFAGTFCFTLYIPSVLDSGIFYFGLKMSILTFLFINFISYILLKGHSISHFLFLIAFITSLSTSVFSTLGLVLYYNVNYDQSLDRKIETRVLDKKYSKTKKNTHYVLMVESWDVAKYGPEVELRVSYDDYEKTALNDKADLVVKEGALGFEWLKDSGLKKN